jgi:hypothetical protein
MVNETGRMGQGMARKPRSGLRSVILMWVVGLALGVAAGAATAMLLMPGAKADVKDGRSLAEALRSR